MITLYVNEISSPCRKVLYLANYLGIPYKRKEMDFGTGELRSPDYLALHPLGKVPALKDGNFVLFESGAICKYLCRIVDSDLLPQDPKEQAIVLQWDDFCVQHIGRSVGKVAYNTLVVPKFGLEVDERSIQEGRKWLKRQLPVVNGQLDKHAFIAGEKLSIADFSLLSALDPVDQCSIDLTPHGNLGKWREKMFKLGLATAPA